MAKKVHKNRVQKKKEKKMELLDGRAQTGLIEDLEAKHTNEIASLKEENESLAAENRELKDKLLRKAADYENARKLMKKETDSHISGYVERIFSDMISILDDFDRAIDHYERSGNTEETIKGLKMIDANFHRYLEKFGITRFSSLGDKFDPSMHEAISIGNDNEKEDGIIIEEINKGYRLKDKTLRPAKVIVNQITEQVND